MSVNSVAELRGVSKIYSVKTFLLKKLSFYALIDIDFLLRKGEVSVLLGESGCGKSTLARILLDIEKPDKGEVFWFGEALAQMPKERYKRLRPKVQAVFQDSFASLNPRFSVKEILLEPYLINFKDVSKKEALEKVRLELRKVGLSDSYLERYPHQLSGGERQRVALARALITNPQLLVLDEPTSALDMTIQSQILELLKRLREEEGLTYLFITHSLSTALEMADTITVMYLGRIVERFPRKLFRVVNHHPYTWLLINSYPDPFSSKPPELGTLKGEPPSPLNRPSGCEFYQRCPEALSQCAKELPPTKIFENQWLVVCHRR